MTVGPALYVGVDGGGTRCRVRVETADGAIVGAAEGGSANVFTDLDGALATVEGTLVEALRGAGIEQDALRRCHVGLGLAGANIPSVAAALAERRLPYASHRLTSDAITGCLGAHAGGEGGIAILGTGAAYVAHIDGSHDVFGGWGPAVSDQGSGADLGRQALAAALLAHDGVIASGPMTDAILSEFARDPASVAGFAQRARPVDFGRFAPLVLDSADRGDPSAEAIVSRALGVIELSLRRLRTLGVQRIALLGSVAPRYVERLSADLRACLVEPAGSALDGALLLARQ